MTELKYKDITEKIIGASFEVHKFFGDWVSGIGSKSLTFKRLVPLNEISEIHKSI